MFLCNTQKNQPFFFKIQCVYIIIHTMFRNFPFFISLLRLRLYCVLCMWAEQNCLESYSKFEFFSLLCFSFQNKAAPYNRYKFWCNDLVLTCIGQMIYERVPFCNVNQWKWSSLLLFPNRASHMEIFCCCAFFKPT